MHHVGRRTYSRQAGRQAGRLVSLSVQEEGVGQDGLPLTLCGETESRRRHALITVQLQHARRNQGGRTKGSGRRKGSGPWV